LSFIQAYDNTGHGLVVDGKHNRLYRVTSANNGGDGIAISEQYTAEGFNTLVDVNAFNNDGDGIVVGNSGQHTIITTAAVVNNGGDGINVVGNRTLVRDTTIVGNGFSGISVASASVKSTFVGIARLFDADNFANGGNNSISAVELGGTGSFVGMSAAIGVDPIRFSTNDWETASSDVTWGRSNLAANAVGRCDQLIENDCTVNTWDWSLKTSDTTALNQRTTLAEMSYEFITQSAHTASSEFVLSRNLSDTGECSYISGTVTCLAKFLDNANEVMLDHVGNDNGLCELGEDCVFTPNYGRYQGHGSLGSLSAPAVPAGYNVQLRASNGY
jgi:hypothetical protein